MTQKDPYTPVHFSEVFNLTCKEEDLDFFDTNLKFDSKLFIDPFLLKKSGLESERKLFERFGDFFRYVYNQSLNAGTSQREREELMMLLDFSEPKEIGLGYTKHSNDGSSPGKNFAKLLIKFFLNDSARKLIKEDNLYPDRKFNPLTLEVFTNRLGVDGLSDITANLIMDYLISYTQKQCDIHEIPRDKELALDHDGFDFDPDEMNWRGGNRYKLPENPLKPGKAIILVPKRFLRAEDIDDEKMVKKVIGILSTDPHLCSRFTKLLEKELSEFNVVDIRRVFLEEHSVFKKYMEFIDKEDHDSYDFTEDPLAFLAHKKYKDLFDHLKKKKDIRTHKQVLNITQKFFIEAVKHMSSTDIWRDMWKWGKNNKISRPNSEKVAQRTLFAMGKAYFINFPQLTFEPEVGTGNGPVDFKIIFKDCRIAIEVKRLLSSSYLEGIKSQLVQYSKLADTNYAIYITIQHYTKSFPQLNGKSHDGRISKIKSEILDIENNLKNEHTKFRGLFYYNADVSPKPSASK